MFERSLTERVSSWLIGWRDAGLPVDVLEVARVYMLDWLGSALAGLATVPGAKLRDYGRVQPPGQATLVGLELGRSAEVAALVNGGLSHIVEMDDLDNGSVLHPGAVIIPAALAVAEREHCSGKNFLSAVVAGYEVAIRVGEAVGKRHYHYFHNTATCGVFGAAAAVGWLLGLTEAQCVWALGNAGTQAAGLWEFNTDGDMSKHLHAGRAASNGVLAADLARLGFTGARRILEGPRGFFAATAPGADPGTFSKYWNRQEQVPVFKIGGVSIKPHASCRHTHPAIDAALALRAQLPRGDSDAPSVSHITQVHVGTYGAALDLCDNPQPRTPYAAKFSLHYCVAAALSRGHVGVTDFTPQAIADPTVCSLLPRICTALEPQLEARYPAEWPAAVSVILGNGDKLNAVVNHPKGDPENPLTPQELTDKFRDLATYGGYGAQAENLMKWVASLKTNRPIAYGSVS
ncbi:MAG: MmgE/PrpD family protein [Candidatus Binatia bacterium]